MVSVTDNVIFGAARWIVAGVCSSSAYVKVCGCRPHDSGAAHIGAGVRKPSQQQKSCCGADLGSPLKADVQRSARQVRALRVIHLTYLMGKSVEYRGIRERIKSGENGDQIFTTKPPHDVAEQASGHHGADDESRRRHEIARQRTGRGKRRHGGRIRGYAGSHNRCVHGQMIQG